MPRKHSARRVLRAATCKRNSSAQVGPTGGPLSKAARLLAARVETTGGKTAAPNGATFFLATTTDGNSRGAVALTPSHEQRMSAARQTSSATNVTRRTRFFSRARRAIGVE